MKIKLSEIHGILGAAAVLANEKLPLRTAYKFAKLKKELESQVEFYDENYRKIVMAHAILDEKGAPMSEDGGKTIKIKDGEYDAINKEMKELNELEAEIGDYEFKFDDLGELEISPEVLGSLIGFIKED